MGTLRLRILSLASPAMLAPTRAVLLLLLLPVASALTITASKDSEYGRCAFMRASLDDWHTGVLSSVEYTASGATASLQGVGNGSCIFGFVNQTADCPKGDDCSQLWCHDDASGKFERMCDGVMKRGPREAYRDQATGNILYIVDGDGDTSKGTPVYSMDVSTRTCTSSVLTEVPPGHELRKDCDSCITEIETIGGVGDGTLVGVWDVGVPATGSFTVDVRSGKLGVKKADADAACYSLNYDPTSKRWYGVNTTRDQINLYFRETGACNNVTALPTSSIPHSWLPGPVPAEVIFVDGKMHVMFVAQSKGAESGYVSPLATFDTQSGALLAAPVIEFPADTWSLDLIAP